MKTLTPFVLTVFLLWGSLLPDGVMAQIQDPDSVRFGEAALAYAAGSIQKSTTRDGLVNLISGDNQSSGARTVLGAGESLYLKLDNPREVAVGDLFTVYRRVRKVFHPTTREYLGFITIRLAVVKVTQVDDSLTTVEAIRSYGAFSPGDLVHRFVAPVAERESRFVGDPGEISGMIVGIQADQPVTLVAQRNVVYLDHGYEDGLMKGDVLDIFRKGLGIPSRKVGQLRIISTEDRTSTALIIKSLTRIMTGDRYKVVSHSAPVVQPVEPSAISPVSQSKPEVSEKSVATGMPSDFVGRSLKVWDAAGQSRLNRGDLTNLFPYDSGEAALRPEGYKVLDQLIEYLQSSGDERMIRVEGHADSMETGPSLKSRYPSNWELSKARANGIVRYLVGKGGVDSSRLTAIGYGDSRPAVINMNEERGRSNRRVEVVLYTPDAVESKASQPFVPSAAGQAGDDSLSLRTRDHGGSEVTADAVRDGSAAEPGSSSLSGEEPLPAPNMSGTLDLPASTSLPLPESVEQDPAKPVAPRLE